MCKPPSSTFISLPLANSFCIIFSFCPVRFILHFFFFCSWNFFHFLIFVWCYFTRNTTRGGLIVCVEVNILFAELLNLNK